MLDAVYRGAEDGPTVILCHGFGADAHDLASLADVIPLSGPVRWVFPQAPFVFRTAWGAGRAWFPRDTAGIEAFMEGPTLQSLAGMDPPGLSTAGTEVLELVASLQPPAVSGESSVVAPPAPVVLGGFSQGSMVAVEAALRMDGVPAGILVMSGNLIAADRLRETSAVRAAQLAGLRVAQYHGTEDPVLPFSGARRLADLLVAAGADLHFASFPGGHGIPPQLYRDIGAELDLMLGLR